MRDTAENDYITAVLAEKIQLLRNAEGRQASSVLRDGKVASEQAVEQISGRYMERSIFENGQANREPSR